MPQAMANSNSNIHPTGVKVSPAISSADVVQMASQVVPEKPQTAPMTTSITSNGLHMHWTVHQDSAGKGATSAVVLAEATRLHLNGRVDLGMPPEPWANSCMDNGLHIIPVSARIAIKSPMLGTSGFHGDPFDRFIAATAIVGGHSLVTADRQITQWAERTRLLEVIDPAP